MRQHGCRRGQCRAGLSGGAGSAASNPGRGNLTTRALPPLQWAGRLAAALRGPARLVLIALGTSLGCLGSGSDDSPGTGDVLRVFPEQAAKALEGAARFISVPGGFALPDDGARQDGRRGLRLRLPERGESALRFAFADGFAIDVREAGASGAGRVEQGSVVYALPDGASFWTATESGYEEWLFFVAGVQPERPVARWDVQGASLRLRGDGVEVVDAGGVARIHVSAPVAYAAGGRPVAVRLGVEGASIALWVDAAPPGEALLIDPSWVNAGAMSRPRYYHPATRLADGRVLITGEGSADIYDPATDTFTAAGTISENRRFRHGATLLRDGRVLITGGMATSAPLDTAEIYDPATGTSTAVASMSGLRRKQTTTLLPSGKVLVTGDGSAEIYDPDADTWTTTSPPAVPRCCGTATLLPDGKVLVTESEIFESIFTCNDAAAVYDPEADSWKPVASMSVCRHEHTATLLHSGKVLVTGGAGEEDAANAEVYDPAADAWTPAPGLPTTLRPVGGHTTTVLSDMATALLLDGRVLVTGGEEEFDEPCGTFCLPVSELTNAAYLYDPSTGGWTSMPPMNIQRAGHSATALLDGSVLIAGGYTSTPPWAEASAQRFIVHGEPCASPDDCASGFCVDGVCCGTACDGGLCDACSIAAGAQHDGVCAQLTGPVCDDGDACTEGDSCAGGTCRGAVSEAEGCGTGGESSSAAGAGGSGGDGAGAAGAAGSGGDGAAGSGGGGASGSGGGGADVASVGAGTTGNNPAGPHGGGCSLQGGAPSSG